LAAVARRGASPPGPHALRLATGELTAFRESVDWVTAINAHLRDHLHLHTSCFRRACNTVE
jgi:hypothetical protein